MILILLWLLGVPLGLIIILWLPWSCAVALSTIRHTEHRALRRRALFNRQSDHCSSSAPCDRLRNARVNLSKKSASWITPAFH